MKLFSKNTPDTAKKSRTRRLLSSFILAAHLVGLLSSVHAIMGTRTPQGAIAWAVSLNTFPYLAVPAYRVLGNSNFNGYVVARQLQAKEIDAISEAYVQTLKSEDLLAFPARDAPLLVEKLAQLPFTKGNDAELLVNGDATYESIFEGISRATEYLLVQFYIIRDDTVGQELKDRIIERALAGVRCHLPYDEIGSRLPKIFLNELKEAGVQVVPFNTTQGKGNRFQINFRNHRKIVVVDGLEAWVGGLYVGEEYKGLDTKFGFWRDTHVHLIGPIAQTVQVSFVEDWNWAAHELLDALNWSPQPAPSGASKNILSLPTGPADPVETSTLFFINAVNSAEERLWIATPYFVPDEQFISALQLAALRGVDVRILIPEQSDSLLTQLSAWSYIEALEKTGVTMHRYQKGFAHQKVVLVDDLYCTIGTANFDNRSFRLNFEITIAFADKAFTQEVAEMLEADFAQSTPMRTQDFRAKPVWYRFGVKLSSLTAPIQ